MMVQRCRHSPAYLHTVATDTRSHKSLAHTRTNMHVRSFVHTGSSCGRAQVLRGVQDQARRHQVRLCACVCVCVLSCTSNFIMHADSRLTDVVLACLMSHERLNRYLCRFARSFIMHCRWQAHLHVFPFCLYLILTCTPVCTCSFIMHSDGRPTGMAFIEFETPQEAVRAIEKDRSKFGPEYGDRYVGC